MVHHPPLSFEAMRWSVFLISMLTSLTGIALVILGITTLTDTTTILVSRTIPIILIIFGTLVFLSSFLGCFGTFSSSKGILTSFFICLTILIIGQIIVSTISLANKGSADSILDDQWQKAYDSRPRIIRNIQEEYSCCGLRFPTDRAIPKTSPDACLKSVEFGYRVSCYRPLARGFRQAANTVGIGGIVVSAIQLLGLLLTYILIHNLPNTNDTEAMLIDEHRRLMHSQQNERRYTTLDGRDGGFDYKGSSHEQPGYGSTTLGGIATPAGSTGSPDFHYHRAGSVDRSKRVAQR